MATGGNIQNNVTGVVSSLKDTALSLLNLFPCDVVQPSDSGDTLRENDVIRQEHSENGFPRVEGEGSYFYHGAPVQGNPNDAIVPEQIYVPYGILRVREERNNSDNNGASAQNIRNGAIGLEQSGNGFPRVEDVGNNSGTDGVSVQEIRNGAIGLDQSGNGIPRVEEVGNNSGTDGISVQGNWNGAIGLEQSGNGIPKVEKRIQEIIHKAVGVLVKAAEEEGRDSKLEAFKLYKKGLELLMVVYKEPTLEGTVKAPLRSRISCFLTKAESLKTQLMQTQKSGNRAGNGPSKLISNEEMETNNFFENFIMEKNLRVKFEEIKGQSEALQSLKEYLILPLMFPQVFVGRYRSYLINILLFGHPGTGKTMMMSAIAAELPNFDFLKLSVWDLASRFLSDSPERAVKEMFRFFYDKSPCVLILEDIDVIHRPHSSDHDRERWRRIKRELMVQHEGLGKDERMKENKLAMVFVTQKPWCFAVHFRKRINRRVIFDLPSKKDRIEILTSGLTGVRHNLGADDFDELGDKTVSAGSRRFTQADLVGFCRDAMMQSFRKIQEAKFFKQVPHPETEEEGFWIPCCHGDDGATEMSWTDLDGQKLLEPEIEMSDFLESLKKFCGTIDSESEARMQQWAEYYVA